MIQFLIIIIINLLTCLNIVLAEAPKVVSARAPYYCNGLQLKKASKSTKGQHQYHFAGICQVKTPGYRQWIYKQVWLDIDAMWDQQNNMAYETAIVTVGGEGRIRLAMKCENDPWITNSVCLVKEFTNTTEFDNFAARFKVRKHREGETILANFPPLARTIMRKDQIHELLDSPSILSKTLSPPPINGPAQIRMTRSGSNFESRIPIHSSSNVPGQMPTPQAKPGPQHKMLQSMMKKENDKQRLTHRMPNTPPRVIMTQDVMKTQQTSHQEKSSMPQLMPQMSKPEMVTQTATEKKSMSKPKMVTQTVTEKKSMTKPQLVTQPTTEKKSVTKPKLVTHEVHKAVKVEHVVKKPTPIKHPSKPHPASAKKLEKHKVYKKPFYKTHRLAWCYHWGKKCGKSAADAFCKKEKFDYSIKWKIALNVGHSILLGDDRMCLHEGCSGFEMIECERE